MKSSCYICGEAFDALYPITYRQKRVLCCELCREDYELGMVKPPNSGTGERTNKGPSK